jgi:diguanylate cyclase (GGDEF)-like protein
MKEFCGSFIVDGSETILGFDEGMEALTGWPAADVVGHPKQLSLGARLSEPTTLALKTIPLYEGELPTVATPGNLELILHCRDGRSLEVEVLGQPLNGPGNRMLVTVIRVLASSTMRRKRPTLVGRDPWTGLLDANAFYSRLESTHKSAVATARPLSLILIDIDHLRAINDRLDWKSGDEVLQKLAGILRTEVEEGHIARLGDDDFAVLLDEGSRGEARQVAGAIRARVERFRFFPERKSIGQPQVTVSLGTASLPADAENARELIDRAHEALNDARSMGRNRVWCYLRRPRVPVQVPVYFDNSDPALLGYMRDLSPSGFFMQTTAGIDVGMRCALAFPLPGHEGQVHVVGRVVRTVQPEVSQTGGEVRVPGIGLEFERFGGAADRRAIDSYLHGREAQSLRPEKGPLSID